MSDQNWKEVSSDLEKDIEDFAIKISNITRVDSRGFDVRVYRASDLDGFLSETMNLFRALEKKWYDWDY